MPDVNEILEIIDNHQSPRKVKSLNFQILHEAGWSVNLEDDFQYLDKEKKDNIINKNFKTKTGIELEKIYS